MKTLVLIVLLTGLSGFLSALAASVFLLLDERRRVALLPHLVSFATGALLGAAFLGLVPHALESIGPGGAHRIGLGLLLGILTFFLLEKFVLWRHCHDDPCEMHAPSHAARDAASARMILAGDSFHNVLDGVLVAAALMTDVRLGVVTALAVAAHEVPQEVGDLAILLHGGYSRRRALALNLLTSLTSIAGGIVAYYALGTALSLLPYALAFAAASFIYIAVADLIPGLHRRVDAWAGVEQVLFIVLGVALVYFAHQQMH
ncbi:MAG TPA: ZIP family metal transporter [Steroidobacteraceae bacterium]|nr:ZIP family metal transporter [Steroidobacteraceae bacterium]